MIRTRFAPSPTGYLHIGGVRTALFNWLLARQTGGQFILRIDDTDQRRNVDEAIQPILDGFRWLGLDWDEGPEVGGPHGPYYQSQRSDRYQAAVDQLLAAGHAYRDYSGDDFQAEHQAAKTAGEAFVYSRRWMAETDEQAAAFENEGRTSAIRMKMPRDGKCRFADLVRGNVEFAWANETDTVIQRADGSFTYHLANVVDDHEFKISHVVRAVEHLSNTPRQRFIAECLGFDHPEYAHLPFVAEPGGTGKKISKREIDRYLTATDRQAQTAFKGFRDLHRSGSEIAQTMGHEVNAESFNPLTVDFYRTSGFVADGLINYLILLGWSLDDKTEEFTRQEMIEHFSLRRVVKAPASFDPGKLLAFQARHMNALSTKKKVAMMVPMLQAAGRLAKPTPCETGEWLARIVDAAGDRIKLAGDILEYTEFFSDDDQLAYDEKAFQKRVLAAGTPDRLKRFRQRLAEAEAFDAGSLDEMMRRFCDDEDIKIGQIIHAVRLSLTGRAKGLGMFECMEILGRKACLRRIDLALERVSS